MNVLDELKKYQDDEYKKFTSALKVNNLLGVRNPILKNIAKEMVKNNDYVSFLNEKHTYHEENMIHMYILSFIKDKELVYNELDKFVPILDNWAVCDSLLNIKLIDKNRDYFYSLINKYKNSDKEFEIRFSIIMLLSHYVVSEYVDDIFKVIEEVKNDFYYTKMGIAWLLCELMIKFRDKCMEYIKISKLDDFTFNKAIQKMNESFRISDDDKIYLKSLKR